MCRGAFVAVWRRAEPAKHHEDVRAEDQDHREQRQAEHDASADPVASRFAHDFTPSDGRILTISIACHVVFSTALGLR